MDNDSVVVEQALENYCEVKVHSLMCRELTKYVNSIRKIFPAIELARPGATSGIKALCDLDITMDKAKFLIQECAESSKLYLAIRGNSIQSRFEKVSKMLCQNLRIIEHMVPQPLSLQISDILENLQYAKFMIESSEEEAGKMLIALLEQDGSATGSVEALKLESFRVAAERSHITSPKDVLIEKRCIRKLLDKVHGTNEQKENILRNLLRLLVKCTKLIGSHHNGNTEYQWKDSVSSKDSVCNSNPCENLYESIELKLHNSLGSGKSHTDIPPVETPPESFRCPLSSELMFDPVTIASGLTYERIWIEKWFSEGYNICPKTKKKLLHLSMTPNTSLKDLILKWCEKHDITPPEPCSQLDPVIFSSWDTLRSSSISSSISSFCEMPVQLSDSNHAHHINQSDVINASSRSSDTRSCPGPLGLSEVTRIKNLNDWYPQMFFWNGDSCRFQSLADVSCEMYLNFFSRLTSLPLELQLKTVGDLKIFLKDNDEARHSMHSNGFLEVLMTFMIDAYQLSNINAQKTGAQILLAFLSDARNEIPSLHEDAFQLLASMLGSEALEEALEIIQILSSHQCLKSQIIASGILPSIIKIISFQDKEVLVQQAVKILSDLSSFSGTRADILSLGCIKKLIRLLNNVELAEKSLRILKNLCDTKEGGVAIAETDGCIASLVELLNTGSHNEQEYAVTILFSLCSHCSDYCQILMKEDVISSLVSISINGNIKGKEGAKKMLRLLRDQNHSDSLDSSFSQVNSCSDVSQDSCNSCEAMQSSFKASWFSKRKMSFFSKTKLLALF